MKKFLATVLTLTMLLTLAAIPAATGEETRTPVTFTVFHGDSNTVSNPVQPGDTEIWPEIQKIVGDVTLQVEYIVGTEEKSEATLKIAGNSLPDLINPHDAYNVYKDAGVLVDLAPYVKAGKMPNLVKLYGDTLAMQYNDDGTLYGGYSPFVAAPAVGYPNAAFWMSREAVKANGNKIITNATEYFEAIKAFLAAHPVTADGTPYIGFSLNPFADFAWVMQAGDRLIGMHNTGGYYYNPDEGYKAHDREMLPIRYEWAKLLNKYYREGVIDPESFSQSDDDYIAKKSSGTLVGYYDELWRVQWNEMQNLTTNLKYDQLPIPMPLVNEGYPNTYAGLSVTGTMKGLCITTACKDIDRAVQFIDDLCREEVMKLWNYGVEGIHYNLEGGKIAYTDEQFTARQKGGTLSTNGVTYANSDDYYAKTGVWQGFFQCFPRLPSASQWYSDGSGPCTFSYTDIAMADAVTPEYKAIAEELGVMSFTQPPFVGDVYLSPYGYGWDIPEPTDETLMAVKQQLNDLKPNTYWFKMIMAETDEEFESIYAEFKAAYEAIDYELLEGYYTKQCRDRVLISTGVDYNK